jgi:transcriptional repressor NrdR
VREVSSREVGELIMAALLEVDEIAYVRFASVYREFSDVSQFVETLQQLPSKRAT